MSWLQDFRMAYALYEGLVRWNLDDYSLEPAAAAEWSVSDDGLVYTFTIRPDARWSNGDPLLAGDFIYAWMRAILPDTAADYSNMFFVIDGAEAFFRWRSEALEAFPSETREEPEARRARALDLWARTERRFAERVGLTAVDDRTLRVTLARPTAYFLDLVAFGVFYPVHRPCVEGWRTDHAGLDEREFVSIDPATGRLEQRHGWTKPARLVCNGPYVLRWWRYKRGLRLERNPHYHSPGRVRSSTVACLSIEDINTAVLAFETGRVDWLVEVSADFQADMLAQRRAYEQEHSGEIERMLAAGRTLDEALAALPEPGPGRRRDVHVIPAFGTDFYSFNCRPTLPNGRPNPFADARVRRAFARSVDKRAIVERVTRLDEPVLATLIPPGAIAGYEGPQGLDSDPDEARRELAAAGWSDRDGDGLVEDERGRPFPVVDLLYSTNTPRYKNISLALRDMWRRELAVRVELRGKESKFFKEDLKTGNYMIGRGGWYGDYGDPTTWLDLCRTGDGNNDRGYSSPRVDDLLERAANEPDPHRRMALLAECERIVVEEDLPMLVLCQYVQVSMYEPGRVSGLSRHPRLTQYLWRVGINDR